MRALAAIGLWASVSGCGVLRSTMASYDVRPNGQQSQDYLLRRSLAYGQANTALAKLARKGEYRPDDKLLAQLYIGLTAYYAGEYRKSVHALQQAHDMAEDRYTKSVSKGSLSMVTSDRALPYMPGDNERLLVHYYGMLAYLKLGEMEDAAVEARRLSSLLERFDEKRGEMDASTRALLRYVAGAVFEATGDANDADVAYRNARRLAGDSAFRSVRMGGPKHTSVTPARTVALAGTERPDYGEVLVVLEYGFVAHKVEQELLIAVGEHDVTLFADRDGDDVSNHAHRVSVDALRKVRHSRTGNLEYESRIPAKQHRERGRESGTVVRKSDVWMKIAWPVYDRPSVLTARPWITLADGSAAPMLLQADLSDAAVADYNRQAAFLLARAVARAGVKQALAAAAEKAVEGDAKDKKKKAAREKHGWVAGIAVQIAGNLLERADTRSWQVLPSQLGVLRLQVPVGTQSLKVTMPGEGHTAGRSIDLGDVVVRAGSISFVTARVWGNSAY